MANRFDYNTEDDEEQDEELDEEEAEDEESEEEQEDEDEQDEEEQQQQLEKRAQKRKDENKLKDILKKAATRFYPYLTPIEELFLRRMQKKGYSTQVNGIKTMINNRKSAFKLKGTTTASSGVPFIVSFAIAILIIILFIVIIGTILPFLFPEDGGGAGMNSPFGIKGDQFYGGRVVYKDDELAQNALVEQYVDIVETTVDNLEAEIITKTIGEGEKTFDVRVVINAEALPMPDEEFDYENLDLAAFQTNYATLYNIVGEIAKLMYKADNDAEAPADFAETLGGIKYFGLDGDLVDTPISEANPGLGNYENILDVVYYSLINNVIIEEKDKSDADAEFTQSTQFTIDDEEIAGKIKTNITTSVGDESNQIRAEKLFIKDYILADAESYIEGMEKKNYVAFIYMPKTNVSFDYVSYMVRIDQSAEFNMTLTNGGSEISLSEGDGEDWSAEGDTSNELTYTFKSGENLGQSVGVFAAIDASDLNKFSTASSLYKIISAGNYTTYLEETTNDAGDKVYTYKTGDMYITFESDAEFMFSDEIG